MNKQLKFNANLTFLFSDLLLVDRFNKAKEWGFEAVELLSHEGIDVTLLKNAADAADLKIVLCNAPMGDFPNGGLGLSGVPGREEEFRNGMVEVIEMAQRLKCDKVQIGPSRIPKKANKKECLGVFKKNICFAAELLELANLKLLIEPLNSVDIPNILLDDIDLVVSLIDESKQHNIQLQFDIYHLARMGKNIIRNIDLYRDYIGHIQFADSPGRGQPGTGEIDFKRIFNKIKEINYQGWVGAEYIPNPTTDQSLAWLDIYQNNS